MGSAKTAVDYEFAARAYGNKAGINIYLNKTIIAILGLADCNRNLPANVQVVLGDSLEDHQLIIKFKQEES